MDSTYAKISIQISESIGKVSALVEVPERPKALLVLAHGAGAGMTHRFMEELSTQLVQKSIAVVRYNFPYMENKKGRPDPPAIAENTVSGVINEAHKLYPTLPLFASGKSFGGRMSSQKLSKECPEFVMGIVFYGFPLHPIGLPSVEERLILKAFTYPCYSFRERKISLLNYLSLKTHALNL